MFFMFLILLCYIGLFQSWVHPFNHSITFYQLPSCFQLLSVSLLHCLSRLLFLHLLTFVIFLHLSSVVSFFVFLFLGETPVLCPIPSRQSYMYIIPRCKGVLDTVSTSILSGSLPSQKKINKQGQNTTGVIITGTRHFFIIIVTFSTN